MTAAAEYKRASVACMNAIARLQTAMHSHAERQAQHPEWWTYVGDPKKTRLDLLAACAFLGDDEAREILGAEGESR